jgi:hypothetical protein
VFGNNPDLEMQDLAIEEIQRQSFEAEAEIDQFMRVITPRLQQADLQRDADAIEAMEKLNAYTAQSLPPAPEPLKLVGPKEDVKVVSR